MHKVIHIIHKNNSNICGKKEGVTTMRVNKAIIPAAGLGTRFLPATKAQPKEMLPVVDKPAIQYIVEEAVDSGIKDILIITGRGKNSIEDHFDKSLELEMQLMKKGEDKLLEEVRKMTDGVNIHYIRQKEAKGLATAIYCAKSFVGDEPFAVLLGDMITYRDRPFLKELIDMFCKCDCPVIGAGQVKKEEVINYGIIDGHTVQNGWFKIDDLVEKPLANVAPSNMAILGRYILTSDVFDIIKNLDIGKNGEYQLTDALRLLLKQRPMYACEFLGKVYDVGSKIGFLKANIDFALRRPELEKRLLEYIKEVLDEKEAVFF